MGQIDAGKHLVFFCILGAEYIQIHLAFCVWSVTTSQGADTQAEAPEKAPKGIQAAELDTLTDAEVLAKVGPLFTQDQERSGILASVSLAQFILESGFGKSELAQKTNNCFGMKTSLSGNTWDGSTWDGKGTYTKQTGEQCPDGTYVTITADFRKYSCLEDSIADHSAYLLGAKHGSAYRYEGLKGCADYEQAAKIIRGGGYATDPSYVDKICSLIRKWDLVPYEVKVETSKGKVETQKGKAEESKGKENTSSDKNEGTPERPKYYRVRKAWKDRDSQIGAFTVFKTPSIVSMPIRGMRLLMMQEIRFIRNGLFRPWASNACGFSFAS